MKVFSILFVTTFLLFGCSQSNPTNSAPSQSQKQDNESDKLYGDAPKEVGTLAEMVEKKKNHKGKNSKDNF